MRDIQEEFNKLIARGLCLLAGVLTGWLVFWIGTATTPIIYQHFVRPASLGIGTVITLFLLFRLERHFHHLAGQSH